jgi:hypothetical protein
MVMIGGGTESALQAPAGQRARWCMAAGSCSAGVGVASIAGGLFPVAAAAASVVAAAAASVVAASVVAAVQLSVAAFPAVAALLSAGSVAGSAGPSTVRTVAVVGMTDEAFARPVAAAGSASGSPGGIGSQRMKERLAGDTSRGLLHAERTDRLVTDRRWRLSTPER